MPLLAWILKSPPVNTLSSQIQIDPGENMLLSFADFFSPIFWALYSYLVTQFGFLQIAPGLLSIKSIKREGKKKILNAQMKQPSPRPPLEIK